MTLGAPPALASAATRYVQVGGNDLSNNCASAFSACATIEHAVAEAKPEDTIQIGPGTYKESIETPAGKPLHFIGSPSSGSEKTLIEDSNPEHPALWMKAGGSLEALEIRQTFPGIGGALQVAAAEHETVTATSLVVEGDAQKLGSDASGSDAIAVNGGALDLSHSTVTEINSVAAVEGGACYPPPTEGIRVVNDGSGIEIGGEHEASANIMDTRIIAERGIALRIHLSAGAVSVADSMLFSGGNEETLAKKNECDGWPVVEAAGKEPLSLIGDTVYNATFGTSEHSLQPADALLVEPVTGNSVTLTNTILHAQPSGVGADIRTYENVTASHSSFNSVISVPSKAGEPTVTSKETDGNIAGEPEFVEPVEPATGNLDLKSSSPLIGAGDPAVLQEGETDVTGAPRATACAGGLSVLNIGAFESAAPQCPAAEPRLEGGTSSYLYVARGTESGGALEQFLLGGGEGLSKLSPFEVPTPPGAAGRTIVAGSQSPQLYLLEGGALKQYRIKNGGQLLSAATIQAPSGERIDSAALGANGHDLYVLLASTGAPHSIAIEHEYVGATGTISSAAAPLTLPGEGTGGRIAVDRAGRVYVTQTHEAGTSTLFDLRANPDGTLGIEDSLAMPHAPTDFAVAPNGREAALLYTKHVGAGEGDGTIYPVAIAADGALSAATSIPSATRKPGYQNFNNPSGLAFAPDSESLYVTNKDEELGTEYGSLVSPFKVEGNGELEAEGSEPKANFSGGYSFDAGLALSPSGRSAYVPNNHGSPASGSVNQFSVGAEGKLSPGTPASLETQPDQGSVALVTPPPAIEEVPPVPEEHPTVVLSPPAGPTHIVSQGIAGTVIDATTHAPIEGADISACPTAHMVTVSCVSATTDASGFYALNLPAGMWLIQVSPPSPRLFPASADVNVAAGAQTTANFALSAPRPLSHGVTFDTPTGAVSGGVPTVNWTTPFTVEGVSAGAPKHGEPGSTVLVAHLVGLSSNTTTRGTGSFNRAGVILYAVHYGAGGKPQGMSEPMIAQVKCDKQCTPKGASKAHGHKHHGGSGITVTHEGKVGILVFGGPEGQLVKVKLLHHYKVGLIAGGDPLEEATIDLSAIERGEESDVLPAIEGMVSGLQANHAENAEAAHNIADGHDTVNVDVSSINAESHGGMTWYDVPNDGVAGEQPPAARADGVDAFGPEDTRLTQKEIASDEQEALNEVNEYRAGHGEGPLDPSQAAGLLNSLDGYAKEVGELGLTSTREEDTATGLLNYLESANATIEELGLPPHDAEQLYNALRNGAPALFPNGSAELADDERARADEERIHAEEAAREDNEAREEFAAWNREQEAKAKAGEPPYEPEEEWEPEESDVYMDPSGLVESTHHVPLYGATVTLSRSATPHGALARVPNGSIIMSPSNRHNPSRTSVAGLFAWDTFPGYYRITATHAGCKHARTSVFAVPPPRSNLKLRLRCGKIRRARTRLVLRARRSGHGTLVLHAAVRRARGRARAGTLTGTLLIRSRGRLIAEINLNAHGKSLIDLPSMASRRRSLRVTYVGNGLYRPAHRRL